MFALGRLGRSAKPLSRLNAYKFAKRGFVDELVSKGMVHLHNATGLPWWLTIIASTFIVRTAITPLLFLQVRKSQKLGKVAQHIAILSQVFMNKFKLSRGKPNSLLLLNDALSTYFSGLRGAFKYCDFSLTEFLLYPFAIVGVFLSFVFGVRSMVYDKSSEGTTEGGILWFKDLSERDHTYVLPIIACFVSYLSFAFSFNRFPSNSLFFKFRDVLQSMVILGLPWSTRLPVGIFFYWIPSTLLSTLHGAAMRNPRVLKFLKLEPPVPVLNKSVKQFDPLHMTLMANQQTMKRPKYLEDVRIKLY